MEDKRKTFTIMLSDEERADMHTKAKAHGFNASVYIRWLIRQDTVLKK